MSNQAVKKPASQATVGKIIDKIFDLRKKKTELESALKDVGGQIDDLESEVMEMLESSGVEKTATKKGSVSLSTSTVAQHQHPAPWLSTQRRGSAPCAVGTAPAPWAQCFTGSQNAGGPWHGHGPHGGREP